MKRILSFILVVLFAVLSCTPEEFGITEINNPRQDKQVARYGETVTVTFMADAAWEAEIVLTEGEGWAEIAQVMGNEAAGKGTVRVRFSKNEAGLERTAELYIKVAGGEGILAATFTQAAGDDTSAMSTHLNEYMHKRLSEEYLWADAYNELDIDMTVPYDEFLFTHLTMLGDTNIEDGGYYRDYSSSSGERYIYSYIQEVTSGSAEAATKADELSSTYGLGIGPLFASLFEEGTTYIGLTLGYVYPGSPAEAAGLRRGDTIYQVGSNRITKENYQAYMRELFYNPTGSYSISYARYVANDAEEKYDLVLDNVANVTAASYGYNPILFAAILQNSADDTSEMGDFCIGYMASESFDSSAQEVLDYQIQQFIDAGIKDLILDLRYNVGGEVQQSRYLASSIVGRGYDEDIFFKAEFNDGRREEWKFLSGPSDVDKLGQAPAMNLRRLYVIMSENTASASELIISGLKGVDFPVILIGSQSEGKNVGMEVTHEMYNGRRFEFAPITYRGLNGKDEYGPKDGFEPDNGNLLNNQNSNYHDDVDNLFPYAFGDWGNFDFNIALYSCFCDILGMDRPDYSVTKSASSMREQALIFQNSTERLDVTVMNPEIGRFGNVIYR